MPQLRHITAATLIFVFVTGAATVEAQVLDMMRMFVRTSTPVENEPEQETAPRTRRRKPSRYDDCDDGPFDDLIAGIGMVVISSPYWLPRGAVGDEGFGPPDFKSVPYEWSADSPYMVLGQQPERTWAWSTQMSLDYVTDFDHLSGIGSRLLVESNSRFGVDTTFRFYDENRITVDDQLAIGDANLVYRFAQGERLRMRSGVGFNWLRDDAGSDFGFNFTYGGDWFPAHPWIISTDLDVGRLGTAGLLHFRATVGRQVQQAEIFVGYDLLRLEDATADGIVAGVRWWF